MCPRPGGTGSGARAAPVGAAQPATERTATGLPQRRRKDRATTFDVRPAAEPQPAGDQGPGMWLEAFHSGLSGAPGHDAPGAEGAPGSATKGA